MVEEFNVDINGTSRDYLLGDFHEELEDIVFLRKLWSKPEYTKVAKVTKIYEIN